MILPIVPHAIRGRVPAARVLREREGFVLRENAYIAEVVVEQAALGQRRFLRVVDRVWLGCVRQRRFAAGGQEKRKGKSEKKALFSWRALLLKYGGQNSSAICASSTVETSSPNSLGR